MLHLIEKHKIAFLAAMLVAVIYGAHHVVIWRYLTDQNIDYHPILINGDEALLNAPKAQAVYFGKIIVGDFNLYEYKDRVIYALPFISPLIIGGLAKITGSVERALIAGDFIFPAAIFVIFYFIVFELTGKKLLSMVSSSFFIFLPRLAAFTPPALKYLQAAIITMVFKEKGLSFSRIEDPQITVPIYLLLIYFAARSMTRNDKISPWLAAFFYGLTFYSYLYYWTYFSVGIIFLLIILFLQKEYLYFKRVLIVFLGGLLLSVPHWINTANLAGLAQFHEITARHGPEIGRILNFEMLPSFAYGLHAALIVSFLFFRKLYPRLSAMFIAFLLPIFVVYNIQIITGFNAQPDHWLKPTLPILYMAFSALILWAFSSLPRLFSAKYVITAAAALTMLVSAKAIITSDAFVRFTSVLIALFAALAAFAVFLNQKYRPASPARSWAIIGVVLIISALANGTVAQYKFIKEYKDVTMLPEEAASYEWLTKNTPKYSVVGSPSFSTMSRVQLYTHNKIFVPNGYSTIASNDEIWERFLYISKLFGITAEKFAQLLASEDAGGFNKSPANANDLYPFFKPDMDQSAAYYLFHMRYHNTKPGSSFVSEIPLAFPKKAVDEKFNEYSAFIKSELLPAFYKLDYLYFGPREEKLGIDPQAVLGESLEKVYGQNGIRIYKLPKHLQKP